MRIWKSASLRDGSVAQNLIQYLEKKKKNEVKIHHWDLFFQHSSMKKFLLMAAQWLNSLISLLHQWHPIWVLVLVLAAPILFQLPAYRLEKQKKIPTLHFKLVSFSSDHFTIRGVSHKRKIFQSISHSLHKCSFLIEINKILKTGILT